MFAVDPLLSQSSSWMALAGGGGEMNSFPTASQCSGGLWQHHIPSHAEQVSGQQSPTLTQIRSQ